MDAAPHAEPTAQLPRAYRLPPGNLPAAGWFLATLAALAVYAPALNFQFTIDDLEIIGNNERIRDMFNPRAYLATSWWDMPGLHKEYRPATMATFALNYALSGLKPWPYYAVNVAMHAINCALVWCLAVLLMPPGRKRLLCATTAGLLFAIHPIHVEAVAGIVGRAELMMTLGFLFALIASLKAWNAPSGFRRWLWSGAVFIAAGFSAFSKEQGVAIPVLIAVLAMAAPMPVMNESAKQRLHFAAPVIAAAAPIALYFVARQQVLGSMFRPEDSPILPTINPLLYLNEQPRMLAKLALLARTSGMLVFPLGQSPDYSYKAIDPFELASGPLWALGAVLVLGSLAALGASVRRPLVFAGLLLILIPMPFYSNLFFIGGTMLGERLLYLPSAGICLLAAWIVGHQPRGRFMRGALIGLVALWGAALLVLHQQYLPHWRDNYSILKYAVTHRPEIANMHFGYAHELRKRGDLEGALRHFEESLRILPEGPASLGWRAVVLADLGREEEALAAFEAVHDRVPFTREAYADLLARRGELAKAEALLEAGVATDPSQESIAALERWRAAYRPHH